MTQTVMPSLSTEGWITSTPSIADALISHFFVSEYSQTLLYPGQVASFPWIIQNNQNDMVSTVRQMKAVLLAYFSRYFTDVVIDLTQKEVPPDSGRVQLDLFMKFKDADSKEFVLARVVEVVESKINRVLKINNASSA